MFELAALTYGVLASFVMASVSRNRREERRNATLLTLFAWLMAAFSLSAAVLLIGYVGWQALSGNPA